MEVSNEDSDWLEPDEASDERKAALVGQILRGELTPQEACVSERLSEAELKGWVRDYTRAARRAIDNQVAAALAAHGLELDENPSAELSGNLGSVGLAELIQTIQFGKKDAHIRIDHDGEQSELWCEEGDVIDATSAQLTGSAAVYRILTIEHGQLHADFVLVDRPRTVHASTQALMLEAAKRADECAEIRSRLGDTLNVYVPSSSAPPELEIEPDQAAVLRAFDGERCVDDVVHQSELPDLETLTLIERLMDQEWLVLKPFHSVRRVSRAPQPAQVMPSVVDASVLPIAATLASRLSWHTAKHRLWTSAFAGVAVVTVAFAIGFYSARTDEPPAVATPVSMPVCGAHLAPLPGGSCIDRAEVSAGDYQTCVRSGACEPVQHELAPLAAGVGAEGGGAPGQPAGVPGATAGGLALSPTAPASVSADPLAPAAAGSAQGASSAGSGSSAGSPAALAGAAAGDDPSSRCNAGVPGQEGEALNCVTFQQARSYCEWRGGRLPLRTEWELVAAPEQQALGVRDLVAGLSEWAIEPATGVTEASRERAVVLGGGLDSGGGARTVTRLYMNANAQGRSVGFRCVVRADMVPAPVVANRGTASP